MTKPPRKEKRFRVHLSVRYERARDFVVEYAENLSSGGLFVRGHTTLEPLEQVEVQIELPGYGAYPITAEVAHVLTPELAKELDRKPGVGLQIVEAPAGFSDALSAYLIKLGKRPDNCVLVADTECRRLIADAGYQTGGVPPPERLAAMLAGAAVPVIAVVIARSLEPDYRAAIEIADLDLQVYAIDYLEEMDEVLGLLDDILA